MTNKISIKEERRRADRRLRQLKLQALYTERDKALEVVRDLQATLAEAEDRLLAIKAKIGDLHRANGARG